MELGIHFINFNLPGGPDALGPTMARGGSRRTSWKPITCSKYGPRVPGIAGRQTIPVPASRSNGVTQPSAHRQGVLAHTRVRLSHKAPRRRAICPSSRIHVGKIGAERRGPTTRQKPREAALNPGSAHSATLTGYYRHRTHQQTRWRLATHGIDAKRRAWTKTTNTRRSPIPRP
jgi:hypothetical protein